jgi:hypothetical protein
MWRHMPVQLLSVVSSQSTGENVVGEDKEGRCTQSGLPDGIYVVKFEQAK